MTRVLKKLFFQIVILLTTSFCFARTIHIDASTTLVGFLTHTKALKDQQLIDVAEYNDIGVDNLMAANPNIPLHTIKPGTQFLLPTQYILPSVRKGIVINLPEKRLYYFAPDSTVYVFPVAIGRLHHNSSTGSFKITDIREHPSWNVPASVLKEEKLKGNILPAVMEHGPENPLGDYAMRLSHSTILIHGTNFPPSIGKRSTSGCFGMYPEDVKKLYSLVKVTMPVTVIDEPVKIARHGESIYIESHPTLAQTNNQNFRKPTSLEINTNIHNILTRYPQADPLALYAAFSQNMGIPISVGTKHARHIHKARSSYRN